MKRYKIKSLFAIATSSLVCMSALAAETMTFAGWGGVLQDAQRKAYLVPASEKLGIKINEDTLDGLAALRAQVLSGKPTWDLVELGTSECTQAEEEGLVEPLDFKVINVEGVDPAVVSKTWVGIFAYATVVAWAKDTGKPVAHNWKEFFDPNVKGARALYRQPHLTLEAALLGDGVAPKDLYPLDVDRAFKALERIKPQVVSWWSAGADSAQLLRSREVDFLAIWNGRVADIKAQDDQVDFSMDGGILNHDCVVIPKGAANKALAMKLINEILQPKSQATLATLVPYAPVNSKAYELGLISPELSRKLPTSPENIGKVATVDPYYWMKNEAALRQRFSLFIVN